MTNQRRNARRACALCAATLLLIAAFACGGSAPRRPTPTVPFPPGSGLRPDLYGFTDPDLYQARLVFRAGVPGTEPEVVYVRAPGDDPLSNVLPVRERIQRVARRENLAGIALADGRYFRVTDDVVEPVEPRDPEREADAPDAARAPRLPRVYVLAVVAWWGAQRPRSSRVVASSIGQPTMLGTVLSKAKVTRGATIPLKQYRADVWCESFRIEAVFQGEAIPRASLKLTPDPGLTLFRGGIAALDLDDADRSDQPLEFEALLARAGEDLDTLPLMVNELDAALK